MSPEQKNQREQKRHDRDCDEEGVVVLERTESRPAIRDVDQMEKVRHHDDGLIGVDRVQDKIFGQPVQQIKRQGNDKDVFH